MTALNPLVSIIIPTYNRGDLLTETIQSVINQTYPHWELIIVDDGSTDNSRLIVERFKGISIKYLSQDHTGKLGQVRNAGLRIAKGDLIAFLDSDDLWRADKLAIQTQFLLENPDVQFCISNGERFGDGAVQSPDFHNFKGKLFKPILCQKKFCIYMPSLIFRSRVVASVGYMNEEWHGGSDIEYFYRMAYNFNGSFSNDRLIKIRAHGGSTSKRLGVLSFFEMAEMVEDFKKKRWILDRDHARLLQEIYYKLASHFQTHNDRRSARRMLLKTVEVRPSYFKAWIRLMQTLLPTNLNRK